MGFVQTKRHKTVFPSKFMEILEICQKLLFVTFFFNFPQDKNANLSMNYAENSPCRLVVFTEKVETRVRDRNTILIRIDCTERKILSWCSRLGEYVEESGLADLKQRNNSTN